MVSYQKRGKVWQYEISYKDTDGKYKKFRKSGFKLKSDAVLAASEVQIKQPLFSRYNTANQTLAIYFDNWIMLYKQNYVSNITYMKYQNTAKHIRQYFGNIKLKDLNKDIYQERINLFSQTHAKRTVSCFHKHIRAALLDALDEGIINKDPTRKAVVTGKNYHAAQKFLNYADWKKLINKLDCNKTGELMIYLAALTGMRYGEIAGLTPNHINYEDSTIKVDRTWDYKYRTGFKKTKNKSSRRKIPIDNHTLNLLDIYINTNHIKEDELIFEHNGQIYYSAQINNILTNKLKELHLPRITFHGLRHTHASILLYQGVSILSVSKRLGHSNTTTTQSTYLHIIKELENKDNDQILSILNNSF
ncbi:MAG: site-specific integrase [Lactobacillus sp.]|uniref:tyrosine-type recombinase/integrase n=1 Tax=Bombilactobacillus bombi TaxID=1303590 RepID=UPI0035ED05C7|nr:site-specific integrase [Lactobacillus sp.]